MGNIVKLKQSDIEKIVSNIINEENYDDFITKSREQEKEDEQLEQNQIDDFDTQIQPEELPQEDEIDPVMLGLLKDENGNYYVVDKTNQENPKFLVKTK